MLSDYSRSGDFDKTRYLFRVESVPTHQLAMLGHQHISELHQSECKLKTLVFSWKLGAGNGHVGPFEPIARRFLADGRKIVLIVRDLSQIPRFFPDDSVDTLQVPSKVYQAVPHITRPESFSLMLLSRP